MLARAGDVAQFGAHDLIVMLGCNDVQRDNDSNSSTRTSITEYERNLYSLLPSIRGEYSLFISSFPVCRERTGVRMETLKAYMDVAVSVARACGYDVWNLFRDISTEIIASYWADDGMHFNDGGHAMIANALTARLLNQPGFNQLEKRLRGHSAK